MSKQSLAKLGIGQFLHGDAFLARHRRGDSGALADDHQVPSIRSDEMLVRRAIERFREPDFAGTYEQFQAATAENPHLPPAEVSMADLCGAAKLALQQQNWLQRAVARHRDDPQAYLILGEDALRDGRTAEANLFFLEGHELATALAEDHPRRGPLLQKSLVGRLATAERLGDWGEALDYIQRLAETFPENADLLRRQGRALFHLVERVVPARDDQRPLYLNTQGLFVGKSGYVLKVKEKTRFSRKCGSTISANSTSWATSRFPPRPCRPSARRKCRSAGFRWAVGSTA